MYYSYLHWFSENSQNLKYGQNNPPIINKTCLRFSSHNPCNN